MHEPKILTYTTYLCFFLLATKSISVITEVMTSLDIVNIAWHLGGIWLCFHVITTIKQKKAYGRKLCISFTFFVFANWVVHIQSHAHRFIFSGLPLRVLGIIEAIALVVLIAYIINMWRNEPIKNYFIDPTLETF